MIKGSHIEAREVSRNENFPSTMEETKEGFYETPEGLENVIIQGTAEPLEWKKELDRLQSELENIEKEVEL